MIYCLSCKKHTNDINPVGKLTKNNKPYVSAKCNVCKKTKSKFVSVKDIKGSGFLIKYFQKHSSIKYNILKIIIIVFIFYKMRK